MSRRPAMPPPARPQRGVALVAVLWILALVVTLAATLVHSARTGSQLTRNLVEGARARLAAEAGLHYALRRLVAARPLDAAILAGQPWRFDWEGSRVEIRIQDESGRIDLNTADPDLLDGLLRAAGASDEERLHLLDAIADWRDRDDLSRLNGAERDRYRDAGLPYGPRNADLRTPEELRLIFGMRPALYRALRPGITVYWGHAGIHPQVAPPLVLQGLPGLTEATVADYLAQRRSTGPATTTGTPPGLDRRYLSPTASLTYTVHAQSQRPGGTRFALSATIRLTRPGGTDYQVLDWREPADLMDENPNPQDNPPPGTPAAP